MARSASRASSGDHGLDDGRVLGDRRSRAARDQDRAVLVAHGLRAQAVDEPDRGPVAGELEERRVQLGVHVGRAEEVAALEQLTLRARGTPEPGAARVVDALGSLPDRKALEHGARLQDLDGLLVADAPHPRPAVRLAHDEPVLLEADERRAHGAARHVERRRDVRLDEARVGRDVAADDRLAEGVVAGGGRHRPRRILPEGWENRQQFCFHASVAIESAPVVTVLGLGEAGGRLAADLVAARRRGARLRPVSAARAVRRRSAAGRPRRRRSSGSTVVLALTTASAALEAAEAALPAAAEPARSTPT